MIIVPACRQCNEELAVHQDYLRDWLVVDYHTHDHPAAQEVFHGPFLRAVTRNQSSMREVVEYAQPAKVLPDLGAQEDPWYSIPVQNERLHYLCHMMTRGLYYWLKGERFPDSAWEQHYFLDEDGANKVWALMERFRAIGPAEVGRGKVCHIGYVYTEEEPITWWLVVFYMARFVAFTTGPRTRPKPGPGRNRYEYPGPTVPE
jgi:hypothetical protein